MTTAPFPDTIAAPIERELVVRKSRFIAQLFPVASPRAADERIAEVRKRFWDARHNCTAMVTGVLGDQARSSDDGEPSGTAGMPMLEVLRRRGLTDVVAVVTRYFGGVLLGAGGLIRAYSTSVSEALDEARLVHRRALVQARISVTHAESGRLDNALRQWAEVHGATLGDPEFAAEATFELWIPPSARTQLSEDVAALTAGSARTQFGAERIVDVLA